MATSDSTTKFKADISQLKAQMQAAARQVRLANSEFKAATAGMKDWSSSADGLEKKIKQLNDVLKAQKTQASLAKEEWIKTKEAFGENSAEADRAKIKLNNYEAEVKKTEASLKNYEQDLKDCKDGTGKFADELDDTEKELKDTEKATSEASEGFTIMKGVIADLVASGIKALISGYKDVAAAAKEAYEEFDKASDIMVAKTGATGEALDALRDNYVNVSKTIVADSEDIGTAIGQVSTKFGLAGDDLETLTTKFLEFSKLNNTDVSTSIENVQKAMTAWGVETQDADKFLDLLNATGQKTGASVDALSSSLTTNAATLKDMGFEIDQATAFLGNLEVAGVDSSTVMAGLKKALANSAKEGKTTKDALAELQATMSSTNDSTEKTQAAMELFGNKAGPAIAEACSSGRLNFEDLGKAMEDYEGNLDNTYDATLDASDKIKLTFQGMKAEAGQYIKEMMEESGDDIEEVLDVIRSAFKSVMESLKANAPAIKEVIKNVIVTITNLIKGLIENFGDIMSIVKAVGTVLVATFVVTKIASFATTIVGLVKTFQTLKTATEAATTAQQLLNVAQNANVIGAVTAAVAGLAAAVLWLISTDEEYKEQLPTLTEAEQAHVDKINEMASAYSDMKSKRDENVAGIQEEYAHYGELKNELEGIVDENGKVQEGYEERAAFIVGTLNDALGTEITLTDGIIENYQEEIAAIDSLIEKKKAQAVLAANEEAYTEAIQGQTDAIKELNAAEEIYNNNCEEKKKLESEISRLTSMSAEEYAKLRNITTGTTDAMDAQQKELEGLQNQLNATNGAVGESRTAYNKAKDTYEEYQTTIKNYEGLAGAILEGDEQKIKEELDKTTYDFKTAETACKDTLEKQVTDLQKNYDDLKQALIDKRPGVTAEMVETAKQMVDKAKAEYDKAPDQFAESSRVATMRYADTMGSLSDYVNSKAKSIKDGAVTSADGSLEMEDNGRGMGQGLINGMDEMAEKIMKAGMNMGSSAENGLKTELEEHSPSQKGVVSGENFGQGFINGMENKKNSIWDKAVELAKKAIAGLKAGQKEGSPSKLTRLSGQYFGEGYELGITDMTKNVVAAATRLAFDAVSGLDQDSKKSGVDLVAGFIDGIESMSGEAEDAVSGLGQGAFVKGFKNMASKARNSINSMMENSGNGLIAGLKDSTFTARENLSIPTSSETGYYSNVSNVTNNYNLNQTNNSPKSLSALETYQARRQQLALLKSIL